VPLALSQQVDINGQPLAGALPYTFVPIQAMVAFLGEVGRQPDPPEQEASTPRQGLRQWPLVMIEELISKDKLLANEKHVIKKALGYSGKALHHELIGYRFKKDILKIHENPDDDAVGLNDVAERLDYENPTNVRDQFVDLMATFGLWTVKIPSDFEIRVGPVAYAFHIHAYVPILDDFEPTI
jgi:hypothetical protein